MQVVQAMLYFQNFKMYDGNYHYFIFLISLESPLVNSSILKLGEPKHIEKTMTKHLRMIADYSIVNTKSKK